MVTLILRSSGAVRNVALHLPDNRVIDLRNALRTNHPDQFQFTGLCIVEPDFFKYLPTVGVIETVVAAWLRAIEAGERIGGAVIDDGLWLDLGDRASYLEAHRLIHPADGWRIHPSAMIAASAEIDEMSSIGADCVVDSGAVVRRSVLWPGACVSANARISGCVVMTEHTAAGILKDADV
jgi:NDP-sugar pyrophosphorylase family protein